MDLPSLGECIDINYMITTYHKYCAMMPIP